MVLARLGIVYEWKSLELKLERTGWKERVAVGDEQWNEDDDQCPSMDSVLGADREE